MKADHDVVEAVTDWCITVMMVCLSLAAAMVTSLLGHKIVDDFFGG